MVEVEIKYSIPSHSTFDLKLLSFEATFAVEREECDQYFNAPDRDFGQTDEALRIRQVLDKVTLTYKGPKRDLLTNTRTEIEVDLAGAGLAAEAMAQILTSLGYRPTGMVRKTRRVFQVALPEFLAEICLDLVADLGPYVELEIVVAESQVDAARTALLGLAEQLGLGKPERRSYLELILNRGEANQ